MADKSTLAHDAVGQQVIILPIPMMTNNVNKGQLFTLASMH